MLKKVNHLLSVAGLVKQQLSDNILYD